MDRSIIGSKIFDSQLWIKNFATNYGSNQLRITITSASHCADLTMWITQYIKTRRKSRNKRFWWRNPPFLVQIYVFLDAWQMTLKIRKTGWSREKYVHSTSLNMKSPATASKTEYKYHYLLFSTLTIEKNTIFWLKIWLTLLKWIYKRFDNTKNAKFTYFLKGKTSDYSLNPNQ